MPLEEAVAATVRVAPATGVERVPLAGLPGRRLAAAVRAKAAIPPFTHSAMDGYAVRSRDCPGALRLRGESAAGRPDRHGIGPGEACRISTGARLPDGADAVVRQEDVRREGTTVHVPELAAGTDVRVAGEDVPVDAVVLPAGHVVRPHEVGVVAAAGHMWASCASPARVAILTTGDELVPPGDALGDGTVYESNTHGIRAQAEAAGAVVSAVAHVGDDPDATHAAIVRHLGGGDGPGDAHILITIGGLSVGPHDHIRPALGRAGVTEVVPRILARPGQPTWVGVRGGQVILALPGNPVSAAVCFHIFGRALLGRPPLWELRLPLARPVTKRRGPAELIRCHLGPEGLEPFRRQGSAAISSLAGADALALLPPEADELPVGTVLPVIPL